MFNKKMFFTLSLIFILNISTFFWSVNLVLLKLNPERACPVNLPYHQW